MNAASGAPFVRVVGLKTWFPIRKGVFRKTVGHVRAVDGVDFDIEKGTTLALVGESGCGKTTVGKTILRLIEPTDGTVQFDGKELTSLSSDELLPLRRRMQLVFQDPASSLDPRMLVRDAIAEGIHSFRIETEYDAVTARVAEYMKLVQLDPEQMWRYPHEFSGGQRQRICIARALAVDPDFIVFDESISALDVSIQAQILNLLNDLQDRLGLTYLFITHDLSVVRYLADRVAVMYVGQLVEEGPTEELFADPQHPYTEALLKSIPSVNPDERSARVEAIGDVPSPSNPPPGCRFAARCPKVFDRCHGEQPSLYPLPQRLSRCFLAEEAPTSS